MPASVGKVVLDTRRLDEIAKNLNTNTDGVLRSLAFQVEAIAKTLAPIDTGALRNSLHTEKVEEGTYWVADGVEYGIYQEFGTYKMAAHPFMIPAVERVANTMKVEYERELFK